MKTTKLAFLAALLCAAATPALADWDNIGSVEVSRSGMDRRDYRGNNMDRDVQNFRLGGPVEHLQLTAERSDINCRSVRADFGNGANREIFRGPLPEGRAVGVDLPGDARALRSLIFTCGAEGRRGGTIRIAADVGRYRDAWRRNPDWQNTYARMFNWGSNTVNNWQMIGSESFEGRNDTESSFAGWRGQRTDAIALKPLESDARCSRVSARFERGGPRNLDVNNGDVLRRGQYYKIDLPGDARNLQSLNLNCHAEGARRVTIQIFVSK